MSARDELHKRLRQSPAFIAYANRMWSNLMPTWVPWQQVRYKPLELDAVLNSFDDDTVIRHIVNANLEVETYKDLDPIFESDRHLGLAWAQALAGLSVSAAAGNVHRALTLRDDDQPLH